MLMYNKMVIKVVTWKENRTWRFISVEEEGDFLNIDLNIYFLFCFLLRVKRELYFQRDCELMS